jgi:hypothetical protein
MCLDLLFGCLVVARTLPCLVSWPCSRGSCRHSTFSHHNTFNDYDLNPSMDFFMTSLLVTYAVEVKEADGTQPGAAYNWPCSR